MKDPARTRQALRSATYEEALAERLGMNVTDLRCLELVIDEPGLTPGHMAERSGLTTGAVTGVLDRLEKQGYVKRTSDPTDRRRAVIQPTPATDEVRAAVKRLDQTLDGLLTGFNEDQRSAIRSFLDATAAAVSAETETLRASVRGGFVGRKYTAPLADAARGRLVYSSGAPRLSMNIAPLGPRASARVIMETTATRLHFRGTALADQLVAVAFDGPLPDVRTTAGTVALRYQRKALSAITARDARVALSTAVPWAIELEGGLTDLDGSLENVRLERLEINGGANHIDLQLPRPTGTAVIRVRGIVSSARFARPRGVLVALRVDGGVSHLTLDGKRYSNISGKRKVASTQGTPSDDRYEIEILDGASHLVIGER